MDQNNQGDEITIKELILTIQEYWWELLRSWWKIALITIPFVAFFAYNAITTPPKYQAELKFFVEGDSGSGGLGGLLGTFGLKSGGGKNNPYQILEVLQSNIFIVEVLLEKDNNSELLANKIIETYGLDNIWSDEIEVFSSEPNFRIKNVDSEKQTDLEKIALLKLLQIVKSNTIDTPLRSVGYNEDMGYYSINANCISEEISLELISISYDKIKTFFEEKTLKGYKETRDIIKLKVDSLDAMIKSKMYQMNRFGDSNRGLISLEKGTRTQILQKEIVALSSAQIEAMKSFEMADFNYNNQKSLFMIIDRPMRPVFPDEPSLLLSILKGLLLGAVLGSIYVVFRKVVKNSLEG